MEVSGTAAFLLTPADVLKALAGEVSSLFANSAVSVQVDATLNTVTVKYPVESATQAVVYRLNVPVEYNLLSEIVYVYKLAALLQSNTKLQALVNDDIPDFVAITFSALSGLADRYGKDSAEFAAAASLLDVALPQLIASLNGVWNNRAVSELVFLGSVASAVDTQDLFKSLARLLPEQSDVTEYYPGVYAETKSTSSLADICRVLGVELQNVNFEVYCPSEDLSKTTNFALFELGATATSSSSTGPASSSSSTGPAPPTPSSSSGSNPFPPMPANSTVSMDSIRRYQITLWLVIWLSLALLFIIYSFANMTFKKDSLLYSSFNPNWEDRKRR